MAALTIPYIIPLFLGMTFNARTYSPGVFIFTDADIARAKNLSNPEVRSVYSTVTKTSEIRDALDISGDLALKIKTGSLDVKGSGSYMKNDEDLENSVIIFFLFEYKSVISSLGNARPIQNWFRKFSKGVLGTHYVDEIVYGVEMMAAVKFTATNSTKKSDIKAAIEMSLSLGKNQTANATVSGQLSTITSRLEGKAKQEISYFGTLPLRTVPNTIEGIKDLIANFGTHVRQAELTDGLPMLVNLKKLEDLPHDSNAQDFRYQVQDETKRRYDYFQDGFFRLSEARSKLFSWSRSLPFDLSDRYSRKIGELLKKLNDDMNLSYDVISKIDLTAGTEVVDRAYHVTQENYIGKVKTLIEEVEAEVARTAQVSTDTYIHWGNNTCPGSETGEATKLFENGYAIGSTKDGIGGMSMYDCVPTDISTKRDHRLGDIGHESFITGISYGKITDRKSNPFKGEYVRDVIEREEVVPCAKCHQKDASIVSTFSGTTKCPPSWHVKYTGYLMSGATLDAHTTQYICVDDTPPDPSLLRVPEKENSIALTLVRNGGSLPDPYVSERIVPCVVCGLKGGRLL